MIGKVVSGLGQIEWGWTNRILEISYVRRYCQAPRPLGQPLLELRRFIPRTKTMQADVQVEPDCRETEQQGKSDTGCFKQTASSARVRSSANLSFSGELTICPIFPGLGPGLFLGLFALNYCKQWGSSYFSLATK